MDYDAAVDALTAAPPAEFTARRQALARQLREAGDRDGAARVLRIRKPAAMVALANGLVRYDPEAVDALLGAGAELESTQQAALAGRGDGPAELRAATARFQAALDGAVRRAGRMSGRQLAPDASRRLRELLQAASLGDEETRRALGAGRMLEEPAPLGFGGLALGSVEALPRSRAGAPPSPGRGEAPRAGGGGDSSSAGRRPARAEQAPSRAEARRLERRAQLVAAARARARKADLEATDAESAADSLEGAADVAEEEARRLRREASTARRRASERRRAADQAEAELKRI